MNNFVYGKNNKFKNNDRHENLLRLFGFILETLIFLHHLSLGERRPERTDVREENFFNGPFEAFDFFSNF